MQQFSPGSREVEGGKEIGPEQKQVALVRRHLELLSEVGPGHDETDVDYSGVKVKLGANGTFGVDCPTWNQTAHIVGLSEECVNRFTEKFGPDACVKWSRVEWEDANQFAFSSIVLAERIQNKFPDLSRSVGAEIDDDPESGLVWTDCESEQVLYKRWRALATDMISSGGVFKIVGWSEQDKTSIRWATFEDVDGLAVYLKDSLKTLIWSDQVRGMIGCCEGPWIKED